MCFIDVFYSWQKQFFEKGAAAFERAGNGRKDSPDKKLEKKVSHLQTRKLQWFTWLFPIGGVLALVWFLKRVNPKPSRATYPCPQANFPQASGLVIWLIGALGSITSIRKAKCLVTRENCARSAVLQMARVDDLGTQLQSPYIDLQHAQKLLWE